jgi:hypothetical protein
MSYGAYFWINGVAKAKRGKRREQGVRRERSLDEGKEIVSGRYAKNLKLSLDGGEGKGGPVAADPRETENARAYNLKTHSAFKLLTMAAGYKVLCRCRDAGGKRVGTRRGRKDRRDSKV